MSTLVKRSLNLIRKFRPPHFAAATRVPITSQNYSTPAIYLNLGGNRDSYFKLALAAPIAILVGFTAITASADSGSEVQTIGDGDEQGEVDAFGLRKIEDGSIVSNEHTIKWRIYTDNGRDMFMKGKYDEAEKFFKSAIQEAKEGFGPRDAHVASAYNNLVSRVILFLVINITARDGGRNYNHPGYWGQFSVICMFT